MNTDEDDSRWFNNWWQGRPYKSCWWWPVDDYRTKKFNRMWEWEIQGYWECKLLQWITTGGYCCWCATVLLFRCWCDLITKKGGLRKKYPLFISSQNNLWFITFICEVFLFDALLCFLHSLIVNWVIHQHFYHGYKVYSYFGQDSADIKIDNVTSSRIWSRNSALAQASSGDSILVGFN